jgi:hypothetical protein
VNFPLGAVQWRDSYFGTIVRDVTARYPHNKIEGTPRTRWDAMLEWPLPVAKLLELWSFGMLRCVALVRTEVSEELSASFIRVTRIGELGTTLFATSNRRKLQRASVADSCHPDEGGARFLRNVASYKSHKA